MNYTHTTSISTSAWTRLGDVNGDMDMEIFCNQACYMTTIAPGDAAPTVAPSTAIAPTHYLQANVRINLKCNPYLTYVGYAASAGSISFTGNY